MKTLLKSVGLWLGIGLCTVPLQAQRVVVTEMEPNSVMFISIHNAGSDVVRIMTETQSPHFHEPQAPRFVLTDRKGKFALGIGGYVKLSAEYDFAGISDNVDFYPVAISSRGDTYADNQFQLDATTSTVFLKLVGHTELLGDFVVYTAGNFRGGDGNNFKLRNAYISARGFTVGYDYGSFMDLNNSPATVDFAGPAGMAIYHATQIRYEAEVGKGFKMGVGVEMPVVDGQETNQVVVSKQRMPNFPFFIQYNRQSKGHIRTAAIIRSMTYDNLVAHTSEAKVGWGVLASASYNLTKKLQIYGQGVYGKGIGQFLNDISMLNVDIVPNPEQAGKMQVLPMLGWFGGLQYNFTQNLFVSSTYGQSRLYSDHHYPETPSEQYRYGQYLNASLFWNLTSNLQIGAEYLRGWRTDFNGTTRHANRLNLAAKYHF